MTAADLRSFLVQCGVDDMAGFVEQVAVPMIEALEAATPGLRSLGQRRFDDLVGRETDRLVDLLGAAIEPCARDASILEGGGRAQGS